MENKDNKIYSKVRTNIEGLDRLLYGGLDMKTKCHVVFIQGGQETERTLLGMQMMYGLAQSLQNQEDVFPHFYSTYHDESFMNDMLLNTYIAQCIRKLMVMYVNTPQDRRDDIACVMTRFFFNLEDESLKSTRAYSEVVSNRLLNLILNRADYLLGKEVLYYSNRTNAIHLRSARHPLDITADSDSDNMLFKRKYPNVMDYFLTEERGNSSRDDIKAINQFFSFPFVNAMFYKQPDVNELENAVMSVLKKENIIAIDIDEGIEETEVEKLIKHTVVEAKRNQNLVANVLIYVLPRKMKVPEYLADMIIRLDTKLDDTYIYRFLSIAKSRRQTAVQGLHQYKRRDYGIEVYPGLQTYFEHRRYLQRALVYTHSSVLEDTYQQYIDRKKNFWEEKIGYQDYMSMRSKVEENNFEALYPNYDQGLSSIDILDKIMLSQSSPYYQLSSRSNILSYQGSVTAIIGVPNTYKRFLTFGSIFSSSLNDEHTLIMMLNKDDASIKRRLSCPARACRDINYPRCLECYRKIHLMNICMGNITPDELIYHLKYQLDTQYQDRKTIKRVVVDDLQIIDYCFPSLEKDKMFLPALASVCRDRGISLYILCDKDCSSVENLRAVSDNIVCTSRDEKGNLLTYIERYTGYQNTPSKIYSCSIGNVKSLFECYEKISQLM